MSISFHRAIEYTSGCIVLAWKRSAHIMSELNAPLTREEQHTGTQDRETWQAFWIQQGQAWRTEPEIDAERQVELTAHRSITPDVEQGIYPFKGIKLKRADLAS